jgi:hypothetical protein
LRACRIFKDAEKMRAQILRFFFAFALFAVKNKRLPLSAAASFSKKSPKM